MSVTNTVRDEMKIKEQFYRVIDVKPSKMDGFSKLAILTTLALAAILGIAMLCCIPAGTMAFCVASGMFAFGVLAFVTTTLSAVIAHRTCNSRRLQLQLRSCIDDSDKNNKYGCRFPKLLGHLPDLNQALMNDWELEIGHFNIAAEKILNFLERCYDKADKIIQLKLSYNHDWKHHQISVNQTFQIKQGEKTFSVKTVLRINTRTGVGKLTWRSPLTIRHRTFPNIVLDLLKNEATSSGLNTHKDFNREIIFLNGKPLPFQSTKFKEHVQEITKNNDETDDFVSNVQDFRNFMSKAHKFTGSKFTDITNCRINAAKEIFPKKVWPLLHQCAYADMLTALLDHYSNPSLVLTPGGESSPWMINVVNEDNNWYICFLRINKLLRPKKPTLYFRAQLKLDMQTGIGTLTWTDPQTKEPSLL